MNTASPGGSLQRKVSLYRGKSQVIQVPVDGSPDHAHPEDGSLAATAAAAAQAAAPKRVLKPSASMYYKPLEVKPAEPTAADKAQEMAQILSNPSTPTEDKCALFGITCTSVFDGEVVKKKFTKDFMFKDTYVWIDPITRSLHWYAVLPCNLMVSWSYLHWS